MAMWFRLIVLGHLAMGLSGCVLESKTPLFADKDAKLLLADYPNLVAYLRDEVGWQKSDEPLNSLNFIPEESHYLVKSGDSEMKVFFVPLEGSWWILQAPMESEATYVLVKAEPKELLIYSLVCKALQESGKFGDEIEFKDSSCFITEDADKMGLFKALIGSASEPSTKLVSEP